MLVLFPVVFDPRMHLLWYTERDVGNRRPVAWGLVISWQRAQRSRRRAHSERAARSSFYWRYRNDAAGVLPTGLVISLIVVCILLFTGWRGGELVFRHRVAVYDEPK